MREVYCDLCKKSESNQRKETATGAYPSGCALQSVSIHFTHANISKDVCRDCLKRIGINAIETKDVNQTLEEKFFDILSELLADRGHILEE